MAETEFKERFDVKSRAVITAINAMPGALGDVIPGLDRDHVRSLIQHISRLLGRLDKDGAKHPEFLVYGTTNIAEYLISFLDTLQQNTSSGPQHFVQNGLAPLNDLYWRLERAVGIDADIARQMRTGQVREFQLVLDEVQKILTAVGKSQQSAAVHVSDIEKSKALMQQRISDATQAIEQINAIRTQAERLASGNSRGKDSLERIIKLARDKSAQIEQLVGQIGGLNSKAVTSYNQAQAHLTKIKEESENLEAVAKRADEILTGATQAGLAGSYISERDILRTRQNTFAIVFYSLIAATVIYAIFFIIPAIDQLALGKVSLSQGLLLLLLRATIFLPLAWAIIFTSRQHARIDLIQMDYSAKATTSLAYSGYRGEVQDNDGMLLRLQNSLIARFSEHPERLLSPDRTREEQGKRPILPSMDVKKAASAEPSLENEPVE